MKTSEKIILCDLRSQGVKLFRRRMGRMPHTCQLAFANRVHNFNAGNRTARRPKGLEAQHRVSEPFHCPMVLFHEVVQIF